jgi:hypothetical protein
MRFESRSSLTPGSLTPNPSPRRGETPFEGSKGFLSPLLGEGLGERLHRITHHSQHAKRGSTEPQIEFFL